jgi:hypothetical protein
MYISMQAHEPKPPMAEFALGFFPTWIGLFGISIALLLPLIQSCQEWARGQAGQAPPLNAQERAVTRN